LGVKLPTFLVDPRHLRLEKIVPAWARITLVASPIAESAPCPNCGQLARRVHSRYQRLVADLPWAGMPMFLRLQCRRFFCDQPACPRRIFCEPLERVVPRYGRRTLRLGALLEKLAYWLGGKPGARLAEALGIAVSGTTLLRVLRRSLLRRRGAIRTPPRVLGVDDWALRKGQSYATLLLDLERHCPIELLPDRTVQTLRGWLVAHPGVEVISRDRAGSYAQGARAGAPTAVQVADRWHLLASAREALAEVLASQHAALRQAGLEAAARAPGDPPAGVAPTGAGAPGEPESPRKQRQRARYEAVVSLHRQGYRQKAVAALVGVSRQTVARYLKAARAAAAQGGAQRRRGKRPGRPPGMAAGILSPYREYLWGRWQAGVQNAAQLFREVVAQGYGGSYPTVRALVDGWRPRLPTREAPTPKEKEKPPQPALPGGKKPRRTLLSRNAFPALWRVTWWLLVEPGDCPPAGQRFVERLLVGCEPVRQAQSLVRRFFALVRARDPARAPPELETWLNDAAESGLVPLARLAASLRQDQEAVLAALTLPWSNGPTEGAICRIKVIKRTMYGRAHLDLLAARVLPLEEPETRRVE